MKRNALTLHLTALLCISIINVAGGAALSDLPSRVQQTVKTQLGNGKIEQIEQTTADGKTFFEIDLTMGAPIRYSMGFMLGARLASVYGLRTQRAFGHVGFTNVFVYADPSRDIAVALMTSGKPALSIGVTRTLYVMQTIARRIPRDGTGPLRR